MTQSLRGTELTAKFLGGVVDVEYRNNSTAKVKKTVPVESFLESISSSVKVTGQVNFYPTGLRVHATNNNKIIVGYEMPERVARMKFRVGGNGVDEYDSVFPWGMTFIIFDSTSSGMRVNTFYQFALKNTVTSMGDMMYVWPGTNVYQEHYCCMGSLNVPTLKSLEETSDLPFLFYNGISNHDLELSKFTPYTSGGNRIEIPHQLYRDLAVKEGEAPKPFPYQILKNAMSIKSFLELRGFANVRH